MSKKKSVLMIGETKITGSLQTDILMRAYSEKEMRSIWEAYERVKLRIGIEAKAPSELQKKMAETRKKGVAVHQIAKQHKVQSHVVDAAIKKVAIYSYLND